MDVTQSDEWLERGTAVEQSEENFYFIPWGCVREDKIQILLDRYGPMSEFAAVQFGILLYWRQLPQRQD